MKLKKFNAILLTFLFFVVSLLLIGCESNVEATFLIKNGDVVQTYVIDLNMDEFKDKDITVYDVLKSSSYQKIFNADIYEGEFPYLNAIEKLVPSSERYEFIALYTTLEDYRIEGYDKTFDNVNYYSSSVGINELPVKSQAIYLFTIEAWADYDEELAVLKETSKNELNNYIKLDELYENYKSDVETIINEYANKIDECTTLNEVKSNVVEAKSFIDEVQVKNNMQKQLDDYKEYTKNKINVDFSLYRENEKNNIKKSIQETKDKIDNSSTKDEIDKLYMDLQEFINNQPTEGDLSNIELQNMKTDAKEEISNYPDLTLYRDNEKKEIETIIASVCVEIDAEIDINNISNIINNYKKEIDAIKTNLEVTKNEAILTVEEYVILNLYREKEQAVVSALLDKVKKSINDETDINNIETIVNTFKTEIDDITTDLEKTKEEAILVISNYKDLNLYREKEVKALNDLIEEFKQKVQDLKTKEEVTDTLNEYKAKLDEVKTDADLTNEEDMVRPTVTSSLIDGNVYKSSKLTFDVFAKDYKGNKLSVSNVKVTLNGNSVKVNWDDSVKTSYSVEFTELNNIIKIVAIDNNIEKEVVYHVQFVESALTVTFSMDAFTIGNGYVIEPIKVTLDDQFINDMATYFEFDFEEMSADINGAYLLIYILHLNDFELDYTGNPASGFYLSCITGFKNYNNVPDNLREKLEEFGFYIDDEPYDETMLGEFDYTFGSGWMYSVNNVFPNVGFSDYHPQDGDVIRVQFTLAYGSDIGGGFAMGFMGSDSYFDLVNKDNLTIIIADAINQNKTILTEYQNAYSLIQLFGTTQEELDNTYNELYKVLYE